MKTVFEVRELKGIKRDSIVGDTDDSVNQYAAFIDGDRVTSFNDSLISSLLDYIELQIATAPKLDIDELIN